MLARVYTAHCYDWVHIWTKVKARWNLLKFQASILRWQAGRVQMEFWNRFLSLHTLHTYRHTRHTRNSSEPGMYVALKVESKLGIIIINTVLCSSQNYYPFNTPSTLCLVMIYDLWFMTDDRFRVWLLLRLRRAISGLAQYPLYILMYITHVLFCVWVENRIQSINLILIPYHTVCGCFKITTTSYIPKDTVVFIK